jgi:adenine-specific DNA-methyltransferase
MNNPSTNTMTSNTAAHTELGHSPDALAQRKAELLALLAQTAPELISDQQLNVAKLQELLGEDRVAPEEHYELNWAGKTAARREIQKTRSHTLRPDANNPAQAQHMLIEGENLEVLRVLQKSSYGKVKMIYIDPPYNTGNDSFVYPDNYSETLDEYQRRTGEKNEAGFLNKQSFWKKNSKESGQYHSAWLSMMYPRLYLARNLLRDDGVIFISIDDNESANLKVLCDEIFGSENFVSQFAWQKIHSTKNDAKHVSVNHEYIFLYSKNINQLDVKLLPRSEKMNERYQNPDNDERGPWASGDLVANEERRDGYFEVTGPTGLIFNVPSGKHWVYARENLMKMIEEGRIWFGKDGTAFPRLKRYLTEVQQGKKVDSLWFSEDVGHNQEAKREIKNLLDDQPVFDTPKPVRLISQMLRISTDTDSVVLDFFAGSGTTAHAVMALNLEDVGTRQSISVQMPEVLADDSEAYKAGYRTIADITRARIDKVIAKLKAEHPDKTADLACAHFTLAPSNFKVWRGDATSADALREQLALFQSAEKQGAGAQDPSGPSAMLAELLLKHGLGALGVHAISKPKQMAGVTVHRVLMPNDQDMWLCFEPYTEALKTEMVKAKPAHVVMLNSCFVGPKADELLSNLQLELSGLDIGLTVI